MPESSDLTELITETTEAPASVTTDGQSVTTQPLTALIEADKYLQSKKATRRPPFGVTFAKIVSPGAQQ